MDTANSAETGARFAPLPLPYPLPPVIDQSVKSLPAMQETQIQFLGREDPLEKEMATHSSILAQEIP